MFQVEFAVHVDYAKGNATFQRQEQLPFVPFVGLDLLDDVLGEFKLRDVAWNRGDQTFYCQSLVNRSYWDLRTACRTMAKAGWVEVKEARELY